MSLSKHKWTTTAILGVAALSLSTVLIAQPQEGGFGHHGRHGGGPGHFGGPGHGLLRGLELTDAQQTQVDALFEAERAAGETRHDAIKEAHQSLMNLALSDNYSDEAAAGLVANLATLHGEMARSHARTLNGIFDILTAEQRDELAANLEEMGDHVGGRHGRRGR